MPIWVPCADPVVESLRFMQIWRDEQPVVVQYYEKYWHCKITKWVINFRQFNHANQNTNGAIERWHGTLKRYLREEKSTKVGRKVVWLLEQLVNQLEYHYWCMSCMKWQGRVRNRKIEDIIWKAILKARNISDADVKYEEDGTVAFVRSQKKPQEWHVREGYLGDTCICTWGSSTQGNTCKHQVRSISFLFKYMSCKSLSIVSECDTWLMCRLKYCIWVACLSPRSFKSMELNMAVWWVVWYFRWQSGPSMIYQWVMWLYHSYLILLWFFRRKMRIERLSNRNSQI